MKYDRASKGSRGSASQWNGFLDMHKAFYGNTVGQGLIPPILQSSTIVSATLKKGAEAIGAYQPVRIVKNFGFKNVVDTMPSYEVEPVDAVDDNGDPTDRHGNYGFTLGEGVTEANGGRIVIGGLALVAVTKSKLNGDDVRTYAEDWDPKWAFGGYQGDYDSAYYVVNDGSLCALRETDAFLLAPIGHFKVVSWYVPKEADSALESDNSVAYLAIDMTRHDAMATAVCFDGCPSGYGPPTSQIDRSGNYFADKINLVPALCVLYTGLNAPHDDLPNSYQQLSGDYDGSDVAEVVLQRQNWDFPAVFVNTSSRGIPSGLIRVKYDGAINRLVPIDAPAASVNETSAFAQYSTVNGHPIRMGAALDIEQPNQNPTIEDFNYNSSKTLGMFLGRTDGADYESATRGLIAFANNDFLEAATWHGEIGGSGGTEYSSRYGSVNLSRNVVRSWILMTHEDHTHATVSDKLNGFRMDGALCSCDWGAYKIVNLLQPKSGDGGSTYPKWVEADVMVLDPIRTKSFEQVLQTGTDRTPDQYDNVLGLTPFIPSGNKVVDTTVSCRFPELIAENGVTYARRNFVDHFPQAQYAGVLHYQVRLEAVLDDPPLEISLTTGAGDDESQALSYPIFIHKGARAHLTVYGIEGDGVTESKLQKAELFMPSGLCHEVNSVVQLPVSNVSGTIPFMWGEKYEKIDIRLEWDDDSCEDASFVKGLEGDITTQNQNIPVGSSTLELNRLGVADYDWNTNLFLQGGNTAGQGGSTSFYTESPPAWPTFADGSDDRPSGGGYQAYLEGD